MFDGTLRHPDGSLRQIKISPASQSVIMMGDRPLSLFCLCLNMPPLVSV